jgi:hypothetical protein
VTPEHDAPRAHEAAGREVSLRLRLLDAQVLDADDLPVGRVDDLELQLDDQVLPVTAVLIGQRHLGPRLGGITGRLMAGSAGRLAGIADQARVAAELVTSWSGRCKLGLPLDQLPIAGLEKWLAAHVVRHIPGAGDEGI